MKDGFPICMPPEYHGEAEGEISYQEACEAVRDLNQLFMGWTREQADWAMKHYKWCDACRTGTLWGYENEKLACSGYTWPEYTAALAGEAEFEPKCKGLA